MLCTLPCLHHYRLRWSSDYFSSYALVDESYAYRQDVGTRCGETTQVFKGGVNRSGVARRREKKRGGEKRNSGGYFWSVAARSTGRAWKDKSAAQ